MKGKAIILIIIVFLLLISSVTVYADTYGLGSFINEYRHYMVAKSDDKGGYQVFCTNVDDPSDLIVVTDGGNFIKVTGKGVVRYYSSDYGITWDKGTEIGATTWNLPKGATQKIMESTFTVYMNDGRVFFSPIGRLMLSLVETMKRVDSGVLLTNILAGLTLLVGLIVLGTCFRKAWAFLQGQLRR